MVTIDFLQRLRVLIASFVFRLVSQLSQDVSTPKSPSPERALQRLLSRQQSLLQTLTQGKSSPPGSPGKQTPPKLSRQSTRQSSLRTEKTPPKGGKEEPVPPLQKDGADAIKKPPVAGTKLIAEEQAETGNVSVIFCYHGLLTLLQRAMAVINLSAALFR